MYKNLFNSDKIKVEIIICSWSLYSSKNFLSTNHHAYHYFALTLNILYLKIVFR
ncbi:hypothetical protein M2391_003292 [Myroides odoratus]|nr:hypothetical protein [Myroides odoratus]